MTALRRYWSATTGLFLGIWLALLVLGRTQLFRDPGTFWHTAMGERTLAAGHLFDTDPFSFTFGGKTWIPHEWLAECLMAAIHRVSGLDGLLFVSATTLALVYAWLGHRLIRAGLHWLPTVMILIVAIAASSTNFHARPHVASLAFFALTYGLLADAEARRLKLVHLAWLIPLDILWTNIHGAVLGGMATLGLAVGWWTCSWIIGRDSPITRSREAVWLWLLVVACGLTMVVNPYGTRLPATWMEIMTSPALPKFIQEHAPPQSCSARGLRKRRGFFLRKFPVAHGAFIGHS